MSGSLLPCQRILLTDVVGNSAGDNIARQYDEKRAGDDIARQVDKRDDGDHEDVSPSSSPSTVEASC